VDKRKVGGQEGNIGAVCGSGILWHIQSIVAALCVTNVLTNGRSGGLTSPERGIAKQRHRPREASPSKDIAQEEQSPKEDVAKIRRRQETT